SLKEKYDSALYYKEILEFQFGEYIFKGAFPELAKTQDAKIINKYISNSVIERIIFKDIPEVFDVKNKQALNSILLFSARETSNLFTFENLSQIIGIDRETAKKYVNYLVLSLIIDELWNYTASAAKQIRTNKKVHIIHPSISIAVQKYRREILSINEVMGRYVESIVYQHCRLFADRLFFWRTPQKEEVNIIAEVKNKLIPVEVKYQNQITKSDIKSIMKFAKKYRCENAVVITKDLFKEETIDEVALKYIPAWFFGIVGDKIIEYE
ncbi:MAG: ATP-binding protein, partial [Candidatus Aenigmarchaeota archaeon]|nr:ATP-binding protein [Candidatus Aenigmarchaeota archaeon]